jgi:AraC family transcriptional regulator of adaptative response / DNA-3-methyladenine glycosylase II
VRVPGTIDGDEVAMRAVLGQQISVQAANKLAGRLAAVHGEPVEGVPGITSRFPAAATIAELAPDALPMPRARATAVQAVAVALASDDIAVDAGVERDRLRSMLLALPGIGEWTADYVVLRGTGDPDRFLASDLGVRRALRALDVAPGQAVAVSQQWRPWRSYAVVHLWRSLS